MSFTNEISLSGFHRKYIVQRCRCRKHVFHFRCQDDIVFFYVFHKKSMNYRHRNDVRVSAGFRPILFSPTFDDGKDLDNQNKIVFAKSYVREILSADEFRRTENIFQFNKIACLSLNKLTTVDPKALGQLKIEDLSEGFELKINKFE